MGENIAARRRRWGIRDDAFTKFINQMNTLEVKIKPVPEDRVRDLRQRVDSLKLIADGSGVEFPCALTRPLIKLSAC